MPSNITLAEALNSVVAEAKNSLEDSSKVEKVAAEVKASKLNLSNDEVKGLVKLANAVRSTNIEPTYKDLYTFVGGLNGRS